MKVRYALGDWKLVGKALRELMDWKAYQGTGRYDHPYIILERNGRIIARVTTLLEEDQADVLAYLKGIDPGNWQEIVYDIKDILAKKMRTR